MAHEDGPEDGHRNFSVSRRLNRIEVEAVANGKKFNTYVAECSVSNLLI